MNTLIGESKKNIVNDILSSQELPKENLGHAVYKLYKHTLEDFTKWYKASDTYRGYYRGELRAKRPKGKTDSNHNLVAANIKTITPTIEGGLIKPTLFGAGPQHIESAKVLNRRVEAVWKDASLYFKHSSRLVFDVTVDGCAFLKTNYNEYARQGQGDAEVLLLDNRSVLFDPLSNSIDESNYIFHATLASVGSIKSEYAKRMKSKKLKGSTSELEQNTSRPSGPLEDTTSANKTVPIYLSGTDSYAVASPFTDNSFRSANKLLKLELWFRDLTPSKKKDQVLEYPFGRVVTVVVGISEEGVMTDEEECVVVDDIHNPFTSLYTMTNRFPFTQIQSNNIGDIWGISLVANQCNTQDLLNDIVNRTHDNFRETGNPTKIGLAKYGVEMKHLKQDGAQGIILNSPTVEDARKAITTLQPTPIGADTFNYIGLYLRMNDRESGVSETLKGNPNFAGQSGRATEALQTHASNPFLQISRNINSGFTQTYENIAYMVQEFDRQTTNGGEPYFLENEEIDPTENPEEFYIEYRPEDTANTMFKVQVARKIPPEQRIQLINMAIQSEQALEGSGALVLQDFEDKSLLHSYQKLVRENRERQEAQQQLMLQAQQQQQNAQLTQEALKAQRTKE